MVFAHRGRTQHTSILLWSLLVHYASPLLLLLLPRASLVLQYPRIPYFDTTDLSTSLPWLGKRVALCDDTHRQLKYRRRVLTLSLIGHMCEGEVRGHLSISSIGTETPLGHAGCLLLVGF